MLQARPLDQGIISATASHFGPFQGQAPGHDKADVPRTEDDGPPAGQKALDVDQALGRPGGIDTRRPGTGDVDGAPGAFPAAHSQDYGRAWISCTPSAFTARTIPGSASMTIVSVMTAMPSPLHGIDEALGIFHPGQFFAKKMQAEAVVNTLLENAPQEFVPLNDEDVPDAQAAEPPAAPIPAGPPPMITN